MVNLSLIRLQLQARFSFGCIGLQPLSLTTGSSAGAGNLILDPSLFFCLIHKLAHVVACHGPGTGEPAVDVGLLSFA